jgi:CubicO group peptidase (beta-lactamase class C family)
VDLWGGHADTRGRRPWREDTLVLVYSTSKGLAAMCLALAHSRGLLDYDEHVASYWPEFAAAGKEHVTVRQLLAHQAGLCALDDPIDAATCNDPDALAALLAKQRPAWPPGTRHGYHLLSIGWYESELIRRIDPQRRRLGRFFAEEIAAPLGLEFYFGVPESVPRERIASVRGYGRVAAVFHVGELPGRMLLGLTRRGSLIWRTFHNPELKGAATLNRPEWRAVEVPAGGGVGQVRDIARAYSCLATGGTELGLSQKTLDELTRPATAPSGGAMDLILRVPTAFSLGFLKPSPDFSFGTSARSYGHPGAGGSFAFADPEAGVGYAYAMNRLGFRLHDDPRDRALRDALYACLDQKGAPASAGAPSG